MMGGLYSLLIREGKNMRSTVRFNEEFELLSSVMPISASSQQNGSWVSAKGHARFVMIVPVGVIAATGTLTARIQQATDASGTGAKAITGKSATQLNAATYTKPIIINLRAQELDVAGGFTFIRPELVAATAASLMCALLFGISPHNAKVSQTNYQEVL